MNISKRLTCTAAVMTSLTLAVLSGEPAAANSTPSLSIHEPTASIQLPEGESTGKRQLVVVGKNLSNTPAELRVAVMSAEVDETKVEVPKVGVPPTEAGSAGSKWGYWHVPITIAGLPEDAAIKRYLVLEHGKDRDLQEITVTNIVEKTEVKWDPVDVPKNWVLAKNESISFSIKAEPHPVSGLKIDSGHLEEANDKHALGKDHFEAELTPPSSVTLKYIGETEDGTGAPKWPPPGEFSGKLNLAVNESQERRAIELTVFSSSKHWKAAGAGLILLGIAVWLVSAVYVPGQTRRLEALAAAAHLRESVDELKAIVDRAQNETNATLTKLGNELADLLTKLTETHFDSKRWIPSKPFKRLTPAKPDEFKTFLELTSARITVLNVVVRRGVDQVLDHWPTAAGEEQLVRDALGRLDLLVKETLSAQEAAQKVGQILADLQDQLNGVARRAGVRPAAIPVALPSSREIDLKLRGFSIGTWVLWLVVTWAAGYSALILPDRGFGTPTDLFLCFFWGLGAVASGQLLTTLSPATLRTTLNIQVPAVP